MEHALVAPSSSVQSKTGKQHRRQFSRTRALPADPAALLESATAATATVGASEVRGHKKTPSEATSLGSPGVFSPLVALPAEPVAEPGGRGAPNGVDGMNNKDNRLMLPFTPKKDSAGRGDSGGGIGCGGSGSSSSLFLSTNTGGTEGFSTLSPVGSELSMGSAMGSDLEAGAGVCPGTLRQLESVKSQLTDLLRALAVSFGQVGYCQGARECGCPSSPPSSTVYWLLMCLVVCLVKYSCTVCRLLR